MIGSVLALAGLAGTGVAAKVGPWQSVEPAGAADAPEATDVGAEPVLSTLYLDRYALHTTTSTRGAQRARGDQTLLRGTLTDGAGTRVGEVFASALTMPAGDADLPSTPRLEVQNLQLTDGTIVAMGTAFAQADIANVYTILGGSGRYLGIRGSYTFDHDPTVARPEGDATIAFDVDATSVPAAGRLS